MLSVWLVSRLVGMVGERKWSERLSNFPRVAQQEVGSDSRLPTLYLAPNCHFQVSREDSGISCPFCVWHLSHLSGGIICWIPAKRSYSSICLVPTFLGLLGWMFVNLTYPTSSDVTCPNSHPWITFWFFAMCGPGTERRPVGRVPGQKPWSRWLQSICSNIPWKYVGHRFEPKVASKIICVSWCLIKGVWGSDKLNSSSNLASVPVTTLCHIILRCRGKHLIKSHAFVGQEFRQTILLSIWHQVRSVGVQITAEPKGPWWFYAQMVTGGGVN